MNISILNAAGPEMMYGYLTGKYSKNMVMETFGKNKQEADRFSAYGYRHGELAHLLEETQNPLLKEKLQGELRKISRKNKKSRAQNKISLEKLEAFKKKTCCGFGLRDVIKRMRKLSRKTNDPEVKLILLLLECEYANLSAKQHGGALRGKIYERKDKLLYKLADLLKQQEGWRFGKNYAVGKNAAMVIYIYLPDGEQLSWHINSLSLAKQYPNISDQWDGQPCSSLTKILTYIKNTYINDYS